MQGRSQVFFRDRILYYLSRALPGQGLRGADWNYKLTPVYGVYLMNFSLSGDEQIIAMFRSILSANWEKV